MKFYLNLYKLLGDLLSPKLYEIMRKTQVVIMGKVGWRSRN